VNIERYERYQLPTVYYSNDFNFGCLAGGSIPPAYNRTISSLFCCGKNYINNRKMNCKTNAEKVSSSEFIHCCAFNM
jgi:hypothetical protein